MSLLLGKDDLEKGAEIEENVVKTKTIRTWYGKKKTIVIEGPDMSAVDSALPLKRTARLYAPIYNGLAAGLSVCEYTVQRRLERGSNGLTPWS